MPYINTHSDTISGASNEDGLRTSREK